MKLNALLPTLVLLMSTAQASITSQPWGQTADGQDVELFTLRGDRGLEARITNWGGIVVSLKVPDATGRLADVVLGFDDLKPYLTKHPFFGCITGRYANRIAKGRFTLDGVSHQLTANSGENHIHGGLVGFDKKLWQASISEDGKVLQLRAQSADGEEGFPGKLDTTVSYRIEDGNSLRIDYESSTDKPTIINLTNHSYFNLAGEGSGDILSHQLELPASQYTATDDNLIPSGELASVEGTPLDFRKPMAIGARINEAFKALQQGRGYDHNFVLPGNGLRLAARVTEPQSGRVLEVLTTDPAVQFYTGNHLKSVVGKSGHVYQSRHGFCLETQKYPDSPNHPHFPSCVLRPGETYRHSTVWKFSNAKTHGRP